MSRARADGTMSSWLLYFRNFTNFHTVSYIIWTPLWTSCASAAAILSNISGNEMRVFCTNHTLWWIYYLVKIQIWKHWSGGSARRSFFEAIFSHSRNVLYKIFIIILCDILSFSQQLSRIMMCNLQWCYTWIALLQMYIIFNKYIMV